MLNERTLIHDNIKKFRNILKEYVGRGDIGDAIDNKEVVNIHYAGDDTHRRGWRTIEPHAIGYLYTTDKDGKQKVTNELAVRAWQQAGSSDTYKNPVGRWARKPPRKDHEWWGNDKETENVRSSQPGWRLFKLDGIMNILATGMEFTTRNTFKPGDKQMSIVKEIKPDSSVGDQSVDGADSIDVADVLKQKVSAFDAQTDKFKAQADDSEENLKHKVLSWGDKISQDKRGLGDYDLFKDPKGRYFPVKKATKEYGDWERGGEKIGNLKDLYGKYSKEYGRVQSHNPNLAIQSNRPDPKWKQQDFFNKMNRDAELADKKAQKNEI